MNETSRMLAQHLRVFIAVMLVSVAGSVSAATVYLQNGTLTVLDALSGDVSFDWDQDSEYAITETSVALNGFDIVIPGAGHVGTIYEFVIPNFYDPLPVKKIEINMSGDTSAGVFPEVTSVIGADSDYYNGGPAIMVEGVRVADSVILENVVSEFWAIYPNPDFETISIFVPDAFGLSAITIETQSTVVPVPAAVWLMGSGLLGIISVARKRRSSQAH